MARLRRRALPDETGQALDGARWVLSATLRLRIPRPTPWHPVVTVADLASALDDVRLRHRLGDLVALADGAALDVYVGRGSAVVRPDAVLVVTVPGVGTVEVEPLGGSSDRDDLAPRRGPAA